MHNLALLPQSERDAIERDKQLWFKAYKLLKTRNRQLITKYLDDLEDDDRKDMARRLNTMKRNKS